MTCTFGVKKVVIIFEVKFDKFIFEIKNARR